MPRHQHRFSWKVGRRRRYQPQPKDYVNSTSSGTGQVSAIAYNPDPSGTGIVYSSVADDPNSDVALINLAENLGKDPIRIYEWVRNNIRTEFYYGAHRGAYLTYLERAGNDIDQCALLGALFKAAGYDGASGHSAAPIYRLEYVYVPRTASGPNQVGVYDWAGVSDDASAFSVLSAYSPQSYDADKIALVQMWVSINIPGRGNTRFVPSIKPHLVGRRPSLDALSDYSWNNAALASGSGSTTASSPAISSANLKAHLNGLATTASTAIRADGSLRDLSGAELARLPVVVPEIVSVTAPNATRYPQGLLFTLDENSLALTGIPKSYCGSLRVKVGAVEHWFLAPELMGKQLAVEFDGNGAAILRLGGAEVLRDSVGNSSQSIDLDVTYEFPPAYFSGAAPQTGGKTTTLRQAFVAVSYSFGRTVDRLQKILQDISAKEALSASNITTGDRLQVIGYQYASQLHELAALGVASLDHDFACGEQRF